MSDPVRRSQRKRVISSLLDISSYPDASPEGPFETLVAKLDQETFQSHVFAKVDDILTFALFAAKTKQDRPLSLKASCVFEGDEVSINTSTALQIAHAWGLLLDRTLETKAFAIEFTTQIKSLFPEIISTREEKECFQHLSSRYHLLLHDPGRCFTIEKVEFESGRVSAGLKATRNIEIGVALLPLCSSMSSNCVEDRRAVSVIQADQKSRGPQGPRLILGPFRFANSDCNPNCQISVIPKSHAFTLVTISEIQKGESITVKYSDDESYFGRGECKCETCSGAPPQAKRQKIYNPVVAGGKKKGHRGGKREKRRKKLESFGGHTPKDLGGNVA